MGIRFLAKGGKKKRELVLVLQVFFATKKPSWTRTCKHSAKILCYCAKLVKEKTISASAILIMSKIRREGGGAF